MKLKAIDRCIMNFILIDDVRLIRIPDIQQTRRTCRGKTVLFKTQTRDSIPNEWEGLLPSIGFHPISVGCKAARDCFIELRKS